MTKTNAFKSAFSIAIAMLPLGLLLRASAPDVPSNVWAPTGEMAAARAGAAATLLTDGRVLVTGGVNGSGVLATAERYSPDGGTFLATPPMQFARTQHTSTLLRDGRVLIAGGVGADNRAVGLAELYDSASNSWSPVAPMYVARSGHTATTLEDRRVLMAGGEDAGVAIGSLEIFDPETGMFTLIDGLAATLRVPRARHAAALLANGNVAIAGGDDGAHIFGVVDIYDPKSNTTAAGATMGTARTAHSATTLLDGNVLIAGGIGAQGALQSTEIYYPALNAFQAANPLLTPRSSHHAILLPHNNQVLIVGGTAGSSAVASAELYVPWSGDTGTFYAASTPPVPARALATATALSFNANTTVRSGPNDGLLLLAGGSASDPGTNPTKSAALYGFATVKTDLADYAPGTHVHITGSG